MRNKNFWKNFVFAVLLLKILSFFSFSSADVIPPDTKIVSRCVKFENLYLFPKIILFALETGPLVKDSRGYKIYQIREGECLKKDYKLNQIKIYWQWENNIKDPQLTDKFFLFEIKEPFFKYVKTSDPLKEEEIVYSLRQENSKIKAFKVKEVKKYNNEKTEVINYDFLITPTPIISNDKKSNKKSLFENFKKWIMKKLFYWL